MAFFHKLSGISLDLSSILEDCNKLLELRNKISVLFENLSQNPRSIKLYLGYLNNIIFKNDQAYSHEKILGKLLEKVHSLENRGLLNNEDEEIGKITGIADLLYSENSVLIEVGGQMSNLGKVMRVNSSIYSTLGFRKEEVEDGNVNLVLPHRMRSIHDGFLDKYLKTGKSNVLFKEQRLFIRKKSGFILNSSVFIKPFFDTEKELFKFISLIQPKKTNMEFIVTDVYGGVQGMTQNLCKLFNVSPEDYEQNNFYIQLLCPKLYSFFILRNEKANEILLRENQTQKTTRHQKFDVYS
jgi:PAS domain S-box-containing protein